MPEFSRKHEVMVLARISQPYHLRFDRGALITPNLNNHIIQWRDKDGKPFLPEDVVPQRVGVVWDDELYSGTLNCFGVSWAQHTLQRNPQIADSLPAEERFHTLAVSCLLKTPDDQFIIAKRSSRVSVYQNLWHVSAAGWVDLDAALETRGVMEQVYTELKEEVNLERNHVSNLTQLGLCVHLAKGSDFMEVCFLANTPLKSQEVLKLAEGAQDKWEGKYRVFSPNDLERMIEDDELFNPGGAATIMMALDIPFPSSIAV